MFAIGGLINKAKAMIPKVANVAKKAVSTVSKKITAIKNSAVGKAVASIPSKINTAKAKAQAITKKVAAAVPKAVNAIKKTNKAIVSKAVQKGVQINSAVQTKLNEINEKNQRILDKVKAEGDVAFSRTIRGVLTVGACPTLYPIVSSSITLDFLLQSRKAVLKEYPFLEWPQTKLKQGLSFLEEQAKKANDFIGSTVYNANIPIISDSVGAFTGQRDPDAKSNVFSVAGSINRGFYIKGAVGTVDALAHVAADPYEALEGINSIALSPETTIPMIGDKVKNFFVDKIYNGSGDERAEVAGQVVFEIAQLFIGTGEVKAGTTIAKTGSELSTGIKAVKATTTAEKVFSAGKYLESPMFKNLGKVLDSTLTKTAQKSGDFLDNLRFMLKNKNDLVPSYAGIGQADDFIGTGKMLQDGYTNLKSMFKKAEPPGGSGVNIKSGVASENLGDEAGKIVKGVNEGSGAWDMAEGGGYINGREYSQHAMERMAPNTPSVQAELSRRAEKIATEKGLKVGTDEYYKFCKKYVDPRNIPPSVIEDAINSTKGIPGNVKGTIVHETNDVKVVVNSIGKVVTVIPK